ncbi:MAG: hypothetical protein R2850_03890 [Bacteroidia bacterium]
MKNLYALLLLSIILFNPVVSAQSFLDQVELTPMASLPQALYYFRFKQMMEPFAPVLDSGKCKILINSTVTVKAG